ncbi:MAG TPA: aminoglycoside adenylyltransferase domain-containing protein [Anaerolineales bacterium]|nr:aminoglycoside adenylyltransferase domain-containing protein [Anaerolineales bacterium]
MVNSTQLVDIKTILDQLLAEILNALGSKLKGLYLYGSLVWGDFDYGVSDIDLLAVTSDDLSDSDFNKLKRMHSEFAAKHPFWDNRIEVQYASSSGLKTFRTGSSKMAVISPGEPFHIIDAGNDWLANWYFVHDYGVTLFGPLPEQFIDPISQDEFIQAIYDHAFFWKAHVQKTKNSRPYQSYAVLALCRALYTMTFKRQVSKQNAADWAMTQSPEWADFIGEALYVRSHSGEVNQADADIAYPQTLRFVLEAIEKIKQLRG